jgi:hypothetical protein
MPVRIENHGAGNWTFPAGDVSEIWGKCVNRSLVLDEQCIMHAADGRI